MLGREPHRCRLIGEHVRDAGVDEGATADEGDAARQQVVDERVVAVTAQREHGGVHRLGRELGDRALGVVDGCATRSIVRPAASSSSASPSRTASAKGSWKANRNGPSTTTATVPTRPCRRDDARGSGPAYTRSCRGAHPLRRGLGDGPLPAEDEGRRRRRDASARGDVTQRGPARGPGLTDGRHAGHNIESIRSNRFDRRSRSCSTRPPRRRTATVPASLHDHDAHPHFRARARRQRPHRGLRRLRPRRARLRVVGVPDRRHEGGPGAHGGRAGPRCSPPASARSRAAPRGSHLRPDRCGALRRTRHGRGPDRPHRRRPRRRRPRPAPGRGRRPLPHRSRRRRLGRRDEPRGRRGGAPPRLVGDAALPRRVQRRHRRLRPARRRHVVGRGPPHRPLPRGDRRLCRAGLVDLRSFLPRSAEHHEAPPAAPGTAPVGLARAAHAAHRRRRVRGGLHGGPANDWLAVAIVRATSCPRGRESSPSRRSSRS